VLDERTRYFRRLRRLRAASRRWSVFAGGLIGAAAVLTPYHGLGAVDAVWAAGAGATTVLAWWRWADVRALAAQPVPDPPDPALATDRLLAMVAGLPGGAGLVDQVRRQRHRSGTRGSAAAGLWERFDRAERTLAALRGRLGGPAAEAAGEATAVARALHGLTDRIVAVERALRTTPAEARPALRQLQADHLAQLEQGVAGYEQFVVAATTYLAESGRTGVEDPAARLTDATDRLRGLALGLAELRTPLAPT